MPNGVKFVVDLRADLMPIASSTPQLGSLDDHLKEILAAWFDFGMLELQRITWDSPAALLEKLIAYEAVHEIRSWDDLRNRLDFDRRCYALFHPAMPREPLAIVQVALVTGTAASVQRLLDETAPLGRSRAGRYGDLLLHLEHPGRPPRNQLRGVPDQARRDRAPPRPPAGRDLCDPLADSGLPHLARRASSSGRPAAADELLLREERAALAALAATEEGCALEGRCSRAEAGATIRRPAPPWQGRSPGSARAYFGERRADGEPIDPVARFHLKNGARLERINWRGDTSRQGLRQSLGSHGELPLRPRSQSTRSGGLRKRSPSHGFRGSTRASGSQRLGALARQPVSSPRRRRRCGAAFLRATTTL
jgi:malonyl-CoA decarboxylase